MEKDIKVTSTAQATFPLTTLGLIVWVVFLVMKLCNIDNPNFEWLTWFWVWFPLWIPWALGGAFLILGLLLMLIVKLISK